MRYFVVMHDSRIVSAENVYQEKATGDIHFEVNGTKAKYCRDASYAEYDTLPTYSIRVREDNHFYYLKNNEWLVAADIEYLINLNETEDKYLNHFQSTDFNAGVIYNTIERKFVNDMLRESDTSILRYSLSIPAIQLMPKNYGFTTAEDDIIRATIKTVVDSFKAVYGEKFHLEIYQWTRAKQYYVFYYEVTRKDTYKEMTVEEIEKALGYKIKVVGNK